VAERKVSHVTIQEVIAKDENTKYHKVRNPVYFTSHKKGKEPETSGKDNNLYKK